METINIINIIKSCDANYDNDIKMAAKSYIIKTLVEETSNPFNPELLHTALNIINNLHMKYDTELYEETPANE